MADFIKTNLSEKGIFRLTLARPEVHNAFDDQVIGELSHALEQAAKESPRALLLNAEGKSFSAGADLNWMKKSAAYTHAENSRDARALADMLQQLNEFPCQTVAAVQGAALGGGVGLVSCCDIAVAASRASFGLTEVRLGIIPATISPFVIAAIGARQARRFFATAERIDTSTALRIGLIHQVVESEELESSIEKIISDLLLCSPDAQHKAKQLIAWVSPRDLDESLLQDVATAIAEARASDEGREGINAFLNKRKASWIDQA